MSARSTARCWRREQRARPSGQPAVASREWRSSTTGSPACAAARRSWRRSASSTLMPRSTASSTRAAACRRPSSATGSARPSCSGCRRLRGSTASFSRFFPAAVELFDLDGFDLVISTSHCAVKSVVRPGRAVHVSYCHSPMRYAWDQFGAYFGPAQVGTSRSRLLRPVMAGLARWDRGHRRPRRQLRGELAVCCGADPPIL